MKASSALASCAFLALVTVFTPPSRALVISYAYDSAGRLRSADYGGVSNTTYAYDNNGNLLARTNTISKFVPLAGSYTGLIAANPVSNAGAGFLTLTVSLTGEFTGKLVLAGKSYLIPKTMFDPNGDASLDPKGTPAIHLMLHIDPTTHEITGSVSGAAVASLTAFPAPFGKKVPAPGGAVGTFTALFDPTENVLTKPKGKGFGTVKIAAAGSVKLAGTLADGTKISQGTMLVSDTDWPFYISLNKGSGFLAGLVSYTPTPGTGDFSGTLDWIAGATTLYQPFTTQLNFSAALYTPPRKGERVLDLPDAPLNCDFLAGGTITRMVTLDAKNVVTVPDPNPEKVTIKLGVRTGTLSGSLLFGGKTRKFSGMLQREQNIGAGFFFSDTESLPVFLGDD